jgi:predicted deacetylase
VSTAAATLSTTLLAAAETERSTLVVSLHDVAPITREKIARIVDELAPLGVRCCSLLVVPNYHQRGSSVADPEFVRWLRQLEAAGHEIVMHGYYHARPVSERENLRDRMITRVYTNREGEFYDLPYDEAFRRISQARDEFRNAGLKPHGFIAPAWLLSSEAERAARDCELEYTTRLRTVRDLRHGHTYVSRSLVYSVRTQLRRNLSRAWNAALFRRCKFSPLLRISVHPPDLDYPRVWKQITRFVRAAAQERTVTTYGDWIARMRISESE